MLKPTKSSQPASSGSSYISNDWTPQRRSRHVHRKTLKSDWWWHTQSVNQLKSRCHTHKRLTKRCMEWHEASMHDKQHVSITQQLHRHQWRRDLSLVKRDRRVYGSFLLWIMRIITQRGVFATDTAQPLFDCLLSSEQNLYSRKPKDSLQAPEDVVGCCKDFRLSLGVWCLKSSAIEWVLEVQVNAVKMLTKNQNIPGSGLVRTLISCLLFTIYNKTQQQ